MRRDGIRTRYLSDQLPFTFLSVRHRLVIVDQYGLEPCPRGAAVELT